MRTHTQEYKEQIKEFGREFDYKLTYGDEVLTGEHLTSVTPVCNTELLKSTMKELDFESDIEIPLYTVINAEIGLKVNGQYEYINYGNYIIYKAEYNEDTKSYEYVCYDAMLFTMKDYTELQHGTFPMTVKQFITNVCSDVGLVFTGNNFANQDRVIQSDIYANLGYTYRDILDECSQVVAGNLINTSGNIIQVKYPAETNDTIDESYFKDVNVKFGEKFGAINTVVLSRSAESDNIYYPTTLPANPVEFKIKDNQIMNGNDREDYIKEIYDKLNGLEFYTNDNELFGICYYEPLDLFNVSIDGNVYKCILLNDEQKFISGLTEKIYTDMPEESVTDYTKSDTTDRRINQTTLIVDKQGQSINALITKTDELTQKDVQIDASLNGINLSISGLETTTTTQSGQISGLQGDVSNLDNKIDTTKDDLTDYADGIKDDLDTKIDDTNTSMTNYVNGIRDDLQNQIDGNITTYFYPYTPTLNNIPASEWTTDDEKANHIGDLFYDNSIDPDTGESKDYAYRFMLDGSTYRWELLSDTDITKALQNAQKAQDTADNKRRVFVTQPTVPYDVGDLWFHNEKLLTCMTAKTESQSFSADDWVEKTDYTNDDKANEALNNQILTKEATGETIHLEDSGDKDTEKVVLDGRSEQTTSDTSPSPEFPSEIENVKGINKFDSEDWYNTLHNINSESMTKEIVDGIEYYKVKPNRISSYEYMKGQFKENTQYTLSFKGRQYDQSELYGTGFKFVYTDGTNNFVRVPKTLTETEISIISEKNKTIDYIALTYDNNHYALIRDIILVSGTTSKPYVPYGNIAIDVVGKNLFDLEEMIKKYTSDYTKNADGSITFTPTASMYSSGWSFVSDKQITISMKGTNGTGKNIRPRIVYSDNTSSSITGTGTGTSEKELMIVSDTNKTISKITFDWSTLGTFTIKDFLVEYGTTATEPEPCQHKQYLIDLQGNELCSLPNGVKDELVIENGNAKIIKNIGKVVFDGSENWMLTGTESMPYISFPSAKKAPTDEIEIPILCNEYISMQRYGLTNGHITISWGGNLIIYDSENYTTIPEWKTYLENKYDNGNPVEIQYELETPQEIDLGEVVQPKTFNHVSNISNSEDTNMYVKYYTNSNLNDDLMTKTEGQKIVTETEQQIARLDIEDNAIKSTVSEVNTKITNNYTTTNELNQQLESQKSAITTEYTTLVNQSKDSWAVEIINKINTDGVETLKNLLVKIDQLGLQLSKNDEDVVSLLNNVGLYVSDGKLNENLTNILMKVDRAGALFKVLETLGTIREQEIIQKEKIDDEEFGECQAWYWIGV